MPLIINEWLPNPTGSDTTGEWIEFLNSGVEPVRTSGAYFTTGTTKKYSLPDQTLGAGEYLVINRGALKFTLKNTDGGIFLYGADGTLLDQQAFIGSATEGKSFSRISTGQFLFEDPTPGEANIAPQSTAATAIVSEQYTFGTPLHADHPLTTALFLALAVGALLAFAITAMMGEHAELPHTFFKRN
jgi:Lamin Tail Domain